MTAKDKQMDKALILLFPTKSKAHKVSSMGSHSSLFEDISYLFSCFRSIYLLQNVDTYRYVTNAVGNNVLF